MRMSMWTVAAVAAASVLAACGGSGESDADFEVGVDINGVVDANALTDGETATVNVASGATLTFASNADVQWTPVAEGSTYEVDSETPTSKSLTVSSNAGGTLNIAFVGKDGEATLTIVVAPREFARVPVVEGESKVTTAEIQTQGPSSEPIIVSTRRDVVLDGAAGHYKQTSANPETPENVFSWANYDEQDRVLGSVSFLGIDSECSFSVPLVQVSYPMYVGKTWSGSTHRTCTSTGNHDMAYESTVEAFESVTVGAGTFDSLRVKSETSYTNSDNALVPSGVYSLTKTCWWAVEIGREVKCTFTYHYPNGAADGATESVSEVLTSYTR